MAGRRLLLVTSDLMASSRLAGVARGLGDSLDVRGSIAALPADATYDVVLLDVQSCPEPEASIAGCRPFVAASGVVVAFGPHVWKERLDAAVAAGADAAASRGEVMEGLPSLLERLIHPTDPRGP